MVGACSDLPHLQALRVGSRCGDGWVDQGRATQPEPAPPALDPRRRKFCERFGRHAREAAGCVRKACMLRAGCRRTPCRQSLRRWRARQPEPAARTRSSHAAEIRRALRPPRPQGAVLAEGARTCRPRLMTYYKIRHNPTLRGGASKTRFFDVDGRFDDVG
jgi:hypothetical protein